MKGILTFNLPEEDQEHRAAINAPQVLVDLRDFDTWMRNRLKYDELHEEQAVELASIRDKFYETVGRHLEE